MKRPFKPKREFSIDTFDRSVLFVYHKEWNAISVDRTPAVSSLGNTLQWGVNEWEGSSMQAFALPRGPS